VVFGNTKAWFGSNKIELTKDTVYTHPTEKQCNYNVDSSLFATRDELAALEDVVNQRLPEVVFNITPTVGGVIFMDSRYYVIVHIPADGGSVFVALQDYYGRMRFGSSTVQSFVHTYANSAAKANCDAFYTNCISAETKDKNILLDVYVSGITSKVFLPTYDQMNGGFSYYESASNRILAAGDWCGSTLSGTQSVCMVDAETGNVTYGACTSTYYMRPHLCIRRDAFA